MSVDLRVVERKVRESFDIAKTTLTKLAKSFEAADREAISDRIVGYSAKTLKFGSFDKDNFAVLFADMRQSTVRARDLGAEKTFLTMHAFIPGLLAVVEHYDGYVIDIMGDGIMVFFGGRKSGIAKAIAVQRAGLCGVDMVSVIKDVVNKVLKENEIREVGMGVGCDFGDVVVTKIGSDMNFDTKAIGDCINTASKFSNKWNEIKVSKQVKNLWPEGKNGKVSFLSDNDGFLLKQ